MEKEEFKKSIINAVSEYLANEEGYGDCAQLEIDPGSKSIVIVGADDDSEDKDYYMLMDMVKGSDTDPGALVPDEVAIDEVVTEYYNE